MKFYIGLAIALTIIVVSCALMSPHSTAIISAWMAAMPTGLLLGYGSGRLHQMDIDKPKLDEARRARDAISEECALFQRQRSHMLRLLNSIYMDVYEGKSTTAELLNQLHIEVKRISNGYDPGKPTSEKDEGQA